MSLVQEVEDILAYTKIFFLLYWDAIGLDNSPTLLVHQTLIRRESWDGDEAQIRPTL